jgi:hypothetical protein
MTDGKKAMFVMPRDMADRLAEAARSEMLSRSDALWQSARRYIEAQEAKQVVQ